MKHSEVETETGNLFGNLFSAYDDKNYLKSVNLFKQRFEDNGFNLGFFKGKRCLDVGCGGGRYSIAMAMLGADEVTGVDISKEGITDARKRSQSLGISNVTFIQNTAEELPFKNASYDFVCFSGVLMHMEAPEKGIAEIARILKPGGMVYMLVYATEGVRWPLINILRSFSQQIGFDNFDKALSIAGELDVNKRRTYLDDLFVPVIDFYSEDRLRKLLQKNGFPQIDRWQKGRLDHEETLESYADDLNKLQKLYQNGVALTDELPPLVHSLFVSGDNICAACVQYVNAIILKVQQGELSESIARKIVIGQGHHRLTAIKE